MQNDDGDSVFFSPLAALGVPPVLSQEGSAPLPAAPPHQPSLREPSQQWLSEKTPVEEDQYDKPEELFMIIAEGFKPRRQGLCPPSQPPAAVLSSSPPVPSKNQHHNHYQHCQEQTR